MFHRLVTITALMTFGFSAFAQTCEQFLNSVPTNWPQSAAGLQFRLDKFKKLPREEAMEKIINLNVEIKKAIEDRIKTRETANRLYYQDYSIVPNPFNAERRGVNRSFNTLDDQINDLKYFEKYTVALVYKLARTPDVQGKQISFGWFDFRWRYPRFKATSNFNNQKPPQPPGRSSSVGESSGDDDWNTNLANPANPASPLNPMSPLNQNNPLNPFN